MAAEASPIVSKQRQPRYAWLVMALLWGIDIPTGVVFFSVGVLLPIWKEDMGVTPLQAGLLGSSGFLGFGLMALPASIWLTRYNPRLVTLVCALGMAVTAVLQAAAPTVVLLLLGRIAFVAFAVARLQIQVIFIQQWFLPKLYATINSVDFGSRSVGQVLGLAATPALIVLLGSWRSFFVVIAVALLSFGFLWAMLGRERPRPAERSGGPVPIRMGNPAGVLRRHKVLWLVAGTQVGAATAFASFLSFFPTYAIDRLGVSLTTIGVMMGMLPVGGLLGALSSGPISEAIGRRKPIIWLAGLVLPVIYTALLHVESVPMVMLLFLGAGAAGFAVLPILATIPFDMKLEPREVSVALGLMRTLVPVSAAIGPLLVGTLQEVTGSLSLGLSIVAPLALSMFLGGVLLPETGPKGRGVGRAVEL